MGVADGSIIATIITTHMPNMKTTSSGLDDRVLGMAIVATMESSSIEPLLAAIRIV